MKNAIVTAFFFGMSFLYTVKCAGQFVVTRSNTVAVESQSGQTLINPWAGGLNAVELSKIDADFDGMEDDLFIFDKAGNRTLIFTGSTEGNDLTYLFDPVESASFPAMRNFALLRDFDCDGKRDLFTYSPLGGAMSVWRNTGNGASGLTWEQESEALLSFYEFSSNSYTTNIYTSPLDIPAIFDYDNDGDLDVMSFNVGGSFIEFHLNASIENTGECGFDYFLANRCYGGFIEGEDSNSISLDPDEVAEECTFNVPDPKSSGGGLRHVGSTILAFDANDDNLVDLVLGDVGFTNLVYLENSDPPEGPNQIVEYSISFPSDFGGLPVDIDNFPAAFYEDVDGDGVSDLVVSVNATSAVENKETVHVYLNSGSESLPEFELVTTAFLQNEMLEFGELTRPETLDYNGDGLIDLVVGSRGPYLGEGQHASHLVLMENTGTSGNPSFQVVDDDWLEIGNLFQGKSPAPAVGDWDGDSDEDLIIGMADGTLHYFEFEENMVYQGPISIGQQIIDVGTLAGPAGFDLDQDGREDLIVGESEGNLNYFRNIGTGGQVEFEWVTEFLGEISTIESPFFQGDSSPEFFEFEGSSYLACGSKSGTFFQYEIGGPAEAWTPIDGGGFGAYPAPDSAPTGLSTACAIADWTGDGLPELIVGHIGGGLEFYEGTGVLSASESSTERTGGIMLYPNPVLDQVVIRTQDSQNAISTVEIYDLVGKRVYESRTEETTHFLGHLSSGMYLVRLELVSGEKIGMRLMKE
jgi:hypothetical protein